MLLCRLRSAAGHALRCRPSSSLSPAAATAAAATSATATAARARRLERLQAAMSEPGAVNPDPAYLQQQQLVEEEEQHHPIGADLDADFDNNDIESAERIVSPHAARSRKYINLVATPRTLHDSLASIASADEWEPSALRSDVKRQLDALRANGNPLHDANVKAPKLNKRAKKKLARNASLQQLQSSTATAANSAQNADDTSTAFVYGQREVRAYLASRLSGSFAAVTNVFSEAARDSRVPTPASVLDFGTGPGTAIWAAHARWGNSINSYTGIDISEPMLDSAEALLSQPAEQFINSTHTPIPQDLETASPDWDARPSPDKVSLLRYLTPLRDDAEPTHDLVVAAFTLSELPTPAIRADTVNQLWRRTRQTLVVIDHGSLNGSELVRAVRSQLLETGDAEIIGPCQHAGTCPMTGTQQACMFSQRYWISGLSRTMTGDKRDLNDQRYSYIIIKRKNGQPDAICNAADADIQSAATSVSVAPVAAPAVEEEGAPGQLVSTDPSKWARVMIPPIKKTGQVLADVCTSEGTLERQLFSKRLGKEVYRALRKTMWGDLVPYRPLNSRPSYLARPAEERQKGPRKLVAVKTDETSGSGNRSIKTNINERMLQNPSQLPEGITKYVAVEEGEAGEADEDDDGISPGTNATKRTTKRPLGPRKQLQEL